MDQGHGIQPNLPDGQQRGRFRHGVNRKVELILRQELDDVGKKTIACISARREAARNQPVTDAQLTARKLAPEFAPSKFYDKRKTHPIFHDDLKPKSARKKSPTRPIVYNPLDREDSTLAGKDTDKTRRFPYSREQTVTTEELKKPHVTSMGVIPARTSNDVSGLQVLMEGKPALRTEDPVLGPVERANTAPHVETPLPSDDMIVDKPASPQPDLRPAILGVTGAIQPIMLTVRPSPPEKPRSKLKARARSAKSTISEASSFKSVEIHLPDEKVYSQYNDAIANIDGDRAGSRPGSKPGLRKVKDKKRLEDNEDARSEASSTQTVKSVKELVEEARQIASPGGEKLAVKEKKKKEEQLKSKAKPGPKRKISSSKSSKSDVKSKTSEQPTTARNVDDIIASLKNPTKANVVSDADRKIQEIMERVMARTRDVLGEEEGLAAEEEEAQEEEEDLQQVGEEKEKGEEKENEISDSSARSKSDDFVEEEDAQTDEKDVAGEEESEKNSKDEKTDESAEQTDEQSSRLKSPQTTTSAAAAATASEPAVTAATEDTDIQPLASEQAGEQSRTTSPKPDKQTEDKETPAGPEPTQVSIFRESSEDYLDLKQAWQDLLAPNEVTYEDIMSINAQPSQLHPREDPEAASKETTDEVSTLTSQGFLSSWTAAAPAAAAEGGKKKGRNSIHHFCKVREDVQLPDHLRGVWRRYHMPSKYDFSTGPQKNRMMSASSGSRAATAMTPQTQDPSATHQMVLADERESMERLQSAAARRILEEAKAVQKDSLDSWKQRAQEVFDQKELDIAGKKMELKTDESFLYWTPAPPKWDVHPSHVKEQLFPSYHGAALATEGSISQLLEDEDSEIEELEEEEEDEGDPEEKMAKDRTLSRIYGSAHDLSALSKANLTRGVEEEKIASRQVAPRVPQDFTTAAAAAAAEKDAGKEAQWGMVPRAVTSESARSRSAKSGRTTKTSNSEASTILIPTKQVTGSLKVTNKAYSGELTDKNSETYNAMKEDIFNALRPILSEKLGENFKDLVDIDFRQGSLVVEYKTSLSLDAPDDVGSIIQRAIRQAAVNGQLGDFVVDPLSIQMEGDLEKVQPVKGEKSFAYLRYLPKGASGKGEEEEEFPAPPTTLRRRLSAPGDVDREDDEDQLLIHQDFNSVMKEITHQKQQLKAQKDKKLEDGDEGEEGDEMEAASPDLLLDQDEALLQGREVHSDGEIETKPPGVALQAVSDDKPTRAELALEAGRSYVILPSKRKKKKRKPLDMSRLDAVEQFLRQPPNRLQRSNSLPKVKRVIERQMRVPPKVRYGPRGSVANILDFEEYKIKKSYKEEVHENEREFARSIWDEWFDRVYPPTPAESDWGDDDEEQPEEEEEVDKKKPKTPETVFSDNIEVPPVIEDEQDEENIQILEEEVERLTEEIENAERPNAFNLCRRGAILRKLGYIKPALDDLNQSISLEPQIVDAYWHRHLIYLLQNKRQPALDDLNFILKTNKTHAEAYKSRAAIFQQQGDSTMAIVNYSQAIKHDPNDYQTYFQRAEMYEKRGDMLLAMEDYSMATKIDPTQTESLYRHGLHYFNNGNWQAAVQDFTSLLKEDPFNAQARTFCGRAYSNLKMWNPAVQDLSAAIHLDPNNAKAFYYRGCILRKLQPKKALQDFSTSLLIDDSDENLLSYLHRGILYNEIGKHEDAIPDFEAVLKLDHQMASAHVNLGLIYMTKMDNCHRAIKRFTAAMKADPTYLKAYVCRAEAYTKIKDIKNALLDFTRAIHLRPDLDYLYMYRGQLVLKMGNLDLAAFCVKHAAELKAGLGQSPTQQAIVQTFLKNYDKAIDALEGAARVKPVAPIFVLLGKTQMKAQQWKEAVTSFEKAIDLVKIIPNKDKKPWQKEDTWPPEAAEMFHLAGMCHMEMRDYNSANEAFNSAIRVDQKCAEAFYQRGLARLRLKQSKGVLDFNRALALDPQLFQAFLSRAAYYGLKKNYTKAILNCNEAIKLQPNSVRAYLYRGALKYHIKAYDLAIRDLTHAISIENTCSLAYFNRAVCYQDSGRWLKALQDYGIVLLLGDQLMLKVLINRSLLYYDKQDYKNSLFDLLLAAEINPGDKRLHHSLGLYYHKLNRLQDAVKSFTRALQIDPFFLDALISRGNVFMDFGNIGGRTYAKHDYERALRLEPECLPARVNLAYTLQVAGKFQQAWHQFTATIAINQDYKPALEGRAVINLQMSDTFAAFQDINASIKVEATAEILTNRGVIHQFMNDHINAMRDYQRAIKVDSTYALAYFNAANVYFHTRQFQQALAYYTAAIQFNPRDESAFLNRAITKVLLKDAPGAVKDFDQAISLSPHSAHMYFNRGNLFASLEKYPRANEDYTRALSLQPDDPLVHKRRADVRGKLGQREMAIEDYRRAIEIQSHKPIRPW